jgi:hypothetical protein
LGNPNLSDRRPTCEVRRERRRKIMKDYRVAVLFNRASDAGLKYDS